MKNVSVIIPNFNYAPILDRRVKSIVNQTAKPCEIIFMDDCSTDNSLDVAENLLSQCDIPWRIVKNECNQGVFKQWLKGIELARYNHIWIAEADDYCELNFVEKLLTAFDDEQVVLTYCQSKFDDEQEKETGHYYDYITRYFDFSKWNQDYKEDGTKEIQNYLCCINTIPNASSVIFNKELIDLNKISQISDYRYNGDWLFYIHCLSSYSGNKICYFKNALNYFVRHQSSVFGKEESSTRPIVEYLNIILYLLKKFEISMDVKNVMLRSLIGNLVYWPINAELNVIISEIFSYLPHDNIHLIYNQESEKIISLFKRRIGQYEDTLKEREVYISMLERIPSKKFEYNIINKIYYKIKKCF